MKIISLNTNHGSQDKELSQYITLHKENTDIFLFQEASGNFDVIRRKFLYEWQSFTTKKCEPAWNDEYCETIVLRPGIKLVEAGTFFTERKDQGSGLWAKIEKEGIKMTLCNIHGTSLPLEKLDTEGRIEQTKEVLRFLSQDSNMHIIMGDFNLFPETESISLFEKNGYRNLIKEYKIETTRNEIVWRKHPDNKQLWADYAFLSPEIVVENFHVPKNKISDHLPMELTIMLKNGIINE